MIANSATCRSSASRICDGTCVQPALIAARNRRFTGNQLIAIAQSPDHDGLQQTVIAEALGQGFNFGVVEIIAGLVRTAIDFIHAQIDHACIAGFHGGHVFVRHRSRWIGWCSGAVIAGGAKRVTSNASKPRPNRRDVVIDDPP